MVAAVTFVVGSRANAEDAVQDALRRGWERSEAGEGFDSPTAWIAVVAMNLARSGERRKMAERRAFERMVLPQPKVLSDDTIEVASAVRKLPTRQRQVLVLHYWLDLPVQEIAQRLRISEGTVKNALFRGRRTLGKSLKEEVER